MKMLNSSLSRSTKFSYLKFFTTPHKNFKNKITLSQKNITIQKHPAYLKMNISSSGDVNLIKKTFYFDNKLTTQHVLSQLESEYNFLFEFDKDMTNKINNIIDSDHTYPLPQNEESNHLSQLTELAKKLSIGETKQSYFVKEIMQKSDLDIIKEKNLKVIYFNICNELEKLEVLKKRLENNASKRASFVLTILLGLLIAQTLWFFNMIYNVEHLGWDLVEPVTYLVQSTLFLLGVFCYVKLHKNATSNEMIVKEITKGYLMRRSIKNNFNIEKYEKLKVQLNLVQRQLENLQKF